MPSSGKEPGAPGRTDPDRGSQAIWVPLPSRRPAPPFRKPAGRLGLLPAPTVPAVPPSSPCSVPGPSASILAAPEGPPCQQGLPGGVAEGRPGARVPGGALQPRGGLRGPGVSQRHGEAPARQGPAPAKGSPLKEHNGGGRTRRLFVDHVVWARFAGPLGWTAQPLWEGPEPWLCQGPRLRPGSRASREGAPQSLDFVCLGISAAAGAGHMSQL